MFRQYTQCYQHTPGDRPFNKADLVGFVAGASAPGLIGALAAFLAGANVIGFIILAIQYAATIIAVANEWLFHRLVCIGGIKCAVGTVASGPERGDLGEFDNDQFFDVLVMPHRKGDDYKSPNDVWSTAKPGPSQDGKTEKYPQNDLYLDNFQGSSVLTPAIADLPYDLTRSRLHCEAEGNFWQAMKDYAALLGLLVGLGAGLGAAGGAVLGCAIGGFFGALGCAIGAIIGAIIGALAGGGAAAYLGANAAFNSDPGDVEDANVGDKKLGPIMEGDKVVVLGQLVYDGFHEGWHEFHPLMAVMKFDPTESSRYLEWNPDFQDSDKVPEDTDDMDPGTKGLTPEDMRQGLNSEKFRRRAIMLKDRWCNLLHEAFDPPTIHTQEKPEHRWTVHQQVDGCEDEHEIPPPK